MSYNAHVSLCTSTSLALLRILHGSVLDPNVPTRMVFRRPVSLWEMIPGTKIYPSHGCQELTSIVVGLVL